LLANETEAGALGARARETVERSFTWERYADTLWTILSSAGEKRGRGRLNRRPRPRINVLRR
jgi:hypothetical protein